MFFVHPPTDEDKRDIFKILLQKYKLNPNDFDVEYLVRISKNRTGTEIEQAIIEAKYNAFDEDRNVTIQDIDSALRETFPIRNNFQRIIQN
jgi:SpoVK/Ycf46/Vps4 family AAA+-type ATPase